MASAIPRLFLLSILLGLLSIAANARPGLHFHPCKTILFISSSSSSYPLHENPNFSLQNPSSTEPRSVTFFFTEVQELNPKPYLRPIFVDRPDTHLEKPHLPLDFPSSVGSSIRDRTMDIMSVVGALLFGVGCGALTAATMYLIWSLFSPNRFSFGDSDDEFDDEDGDEGVSPKKMGYVAIPTATVPPPVKEVA